MSGSRVSNGYLRRYDGPEARESFLLCRPDPLSQDDIVQQTESAYGALQRLLRTEGGGPEHVFQETVLFRNIREDLAAFQEVRGRVFGVRSETFRPASTFIEQPPLHEGARLEISAVAIIPNDGASARVRDVSCPSPCACGECAPPRARTLLLGNQKLLRSGAFYGSSGTPCAEAYDMFCSAERLLSQEGLSFHNVVRTWIYLRDIDRDYTELNRVRREFFQGRDVVLSPSSTAIGGAPFPRAHNFSMSVCAVSSTEPLAHTVMTTPTLNEAREYGADFSRGLRVMEGNKVALYLSGTASVDEEGRTAHVGDLDAQVERMLVNVSTLLAEQNASWGDLVSATTYLKRAADAPRLRRILEERGFGGFPNAMVQASVCRPDLLCEVEAIAALPLPGSRQTGR